MVDRYAVACRPVRDVLVRYLDERRPALDYNTLATLAGELAGTFWAGIERHHPGIGTLHLPGEIAQAWKERARIVTAAGGTIRERKNIHALLMRVRAFHLGIQQWALEDPSWVPWAVPSPVRQRDLIGFAKEKTHVQARMHQRVRERLPRLPDLLAAAGDAVGTGDYSTALAELNKLHSPRADQAEARFLRGTAASAAGFAGFLARCCARSDTGLRKT